MIQRKQTIWLLLVSVSAFAMTQVPIFVATAADKTNTFFMMTRSLLLFAMAIITGLLALIAIFLFKNRKKQLRLAVIGFILSVALTFLQYPIMNGFKNDFAQQEVTWYWGSLFPIAMIIFFFLAVSGIRKDEKLIKSLDRFR